MVEEMMKQLELNIVPGSAGEASDVQRAADFADSMGQTAASPSEHSNTLRGADESPAKADTRSGDMSMRKRIFFPANREDALLLLGGICISEYFPAPDIALAVNDKGLALVEEGLRASEVPILNRGQGRNFPLLIEVHDRGAHIERAHVLPSDIKAIWFRSSSESDEFRFRSVEEFDAGTYPCSIDPQLFELEGVPRFGLRTGTALAELGRLADRFSDGVLSIIDLGNRQPSCREAVWWFFRAKSGDDSSSGLEFVDAVHAAAQYPARDIDVDEIRSAIVSAFYFAVDPSPRALLEQIRLSLTAHSPDRDLIPDAISKWLDFAEAVVRSQTALSGDRLSDEKSVLLRGALLGLMVEDMDALETFRNAERPAGCRVTAIAAFLLGLKRGIMSTPWEQKKRSLQSSPFLIADLLRAFVDTPNSASEAITASRRNTPSGYDLVLMCAERALATWAIETPFVLSKREQLFAAALGMDTSRPATRSVGDRGFNIQNTMGQSIEILSQQPESPNCVTLRYYLAPEQKFRKAKDLLEYGSAGGRVWYPARDDRERDFLFCDLVSAPDDDGRHMVFEALTAALGKLLIPPKVSKGRRLKKSKAT
jgi:hypothetical protein